MSPKRSERELSNSQFIPARVRRDVESASCGPRRFRRSRRRRRRRFFAARRGSASSGRARSPGRGPLRAQLRSASCGTVRPCSRQRSATLRVMVEQAGLGTTGRKPRDESLPFAPILPSRQDLRQPSVWRRISAKLSCRIDCAGYCRRLYFTIEQVKSRACGAAPAIRKSGLCRCLPRRRSSRIAQFSICTVRRPSMATESIDRVTDIPSVRSAAPRNVPVPGHSRPRATAPRPSSGSRPTSRRAAARFRSPARRRWAAASTQAVDERRAEPVGRSARVRRAGERALGGHRSAKASPRPAGA